MIGVFGGSVSLQLSTNRNSKRIIESRLKENLYMIERGYEEVIVLPFASGGWRQPQTFYSIAYYIDNIDMAIILDGFNDVNTLTVANAMNWPVRFPWQELYQLLATPNISQKSLIHLGELSFLSDRLVKWTIFFSKPILRNSLFLHSVWKIGTKIIYQDIVALRVEIGKHASGGVSDSTYRTMSASTGVEASKELTDYFDFYRRLSLWQAQLAKQEGVPYFHFVQPNQYVRNSKPLSQTELKKYVLAGDKQFDKITSAYNKLEGITDGLSLMGFQVHSLSNLFIGKKETVYRDDCCHLNQVGVDLMTNKIVDIVEVGLAAD